ncbi:hypothetical protein [Neobacillus sp. Marseille-QA0830]
MKRRLLLLFLLTFGFSVIGCSNETGSTQSQKPNLILGSKPLIIEENNGNDQYVEWKTISDKETIHKVSTLLNHAHWQNAAVSMNHPPDLKINHVIQIWIGPQKNLLEVVIEGKDQYAKLADKDSEILYKMITGKELGDN